MENYLGKVVSTEHITAKKYVSGKALCNMLKNQAGSARLVSINELSPEEITQRMQFETKAGFYEASKPFAVYDW